ncbi:hypothetical protein SAMN05518865_104350 [Duganella sp. CF458]|uniref:hypothetical protein n=1 Tax=Duganella sp. CF458 TaxID=1884368 RepID=UPI0008DF8AA5|nr:hypothetical protein [Duganella sp. CF458]SFF78725.1 hypothetical protein SAMN05518865_104350 [Duganella sp. CF458]
MRQVFVTNSELEYEDAWDRLSRAGIPVFEPSKPSKEGRILCIWLAHQYYDAVELLHNPMHIVATAVTDKEFERIQAAADARMARTRDHAWEQSLNRLVACASLLLLSGLVYITLPNVL